ncbi:MAG: hypothetical protein ACKVRN_04740 [Pyrinomonadaceae bacterium]
MKKCPACYQIFGDENDFCLNDGTPLVVEYVSGSRPATELPTQFIPRRQNTVAAPGGSSNVLYLVIGILATALVGVGLYVFLARDQDKRGDVTDSPKIETAKETTVAAALPTQASLPPPRSAPPVDHSLSPAGTWNGDWSGRGGSYFTARVQLQETNGRVEGQIVWTLERSTNPKKMYKAGSVATEYVRGTFDPTTRKVFLAGYRKDDPNDIVIYDNYRMLLSADNKNLTGKSKNNGDFRLAR